ncbi:MULTISPECIES: hydroxymethylpyrimidine/phosphomethylpyrimidine kinase [Rhizobium]|uniref:Hydroxymethylpyrimidine/phosphomethylpyrimidine kinase n=1 Tax=Rhizobium aouanii TaxID=3118145 RepID=A0ABU8CXZ8_9HYPH|nr:hydroxymethylpyrimidine/phosphomethylpyrimidine kinase [Rhizobium acaciae]MCW1414123.1 hydroxymethylpyrimidine/phosphomethylpyrimidine kinase [Rhizobium acaciae]MCW1746286.1 hydroxymethylpyrimidine/phosphomethylpyrimidine kinase [Rhizobium acaciae]MCW1754116.1 hydroxymethylpyrimidine/phosphomethylpyrimidine kinase [Rhizobium acaciae]
MLATAETVQAISDVIAGNLAIPVILDAVLASSSGTRLLSDNGLENLRQRLLPMVCPPIAEPPVAMSRSVVRPCNCWTWAARPFW